MDSTTIVTNLIIPISTAIVSILTAMGVCISAVGSIKKSKDQIIQSNSNTTIGRLEKSIQSNTEASRSTNQEIGNLVKEVGGVVSECKRIVALNNQVESEYSALAKSSKDMIDAVKSYEAKSQANYDGVRELVNAGKRQMIEAYIEQKKLIDQLLKDNQKLHEDIDRLNKKLDIVIENRRAR